MQSLTQGIAWTTPALLATYDFSPFKRLVDVGGGQGALLRDILNATPGLEGILFDLPQVVSGASEKAWLTPPLVRLVLRICSCW